MSANFFFRSYNGKVYAPVCIGDLDAYDFEVSIHDYTEDVAKYLQEHPNVPGVMLMDQGKLVGVIPRADMFERLGHRYGVELFLRRPILRLMEDLKTETFILPYYLRVETAVQSALKRIPHRIYDPIVLVFDEGHFRLLDLHTLLLVQSQMLENSNGVMNSLGRLEEILKRESQDAAMKMILDALRHVVPFHHAILLLLGTVNETLVKTMGGLIHFPGKAIENNPIYRAIFEHQQSICIDDAQLSPSWVGVNGSSQARSWMGIPLVDQHRFIGILALSRFVVSPFNNNERDMSVAFAWYLSQVLSDRIQPSFIEDNPFAHILVRQERFQQPALQAIKSSTNLTL